MNFDNTGFGQRALVRISGVQVESHFFFYYSIIYVKLFDLIRNLRSAKFDQEMTPSTCSSDPDRKPFLLDKRIIWINYSIHEKFDSFSNVDAGPSRCWWDPDRKPCFSIKILSELICSNYLKIYLFDNDDLLKSRIVTGP